MKFSTVENYPMTATYRPWEPEFKENEQLTYRKYAEQPETIDCLVMVSPIGAVSLYTDRNLQLFGIIDGMFDAAGTPVMNEVWYSVQKVTPVFDSAGYIKSYKHNIAILAPELVTVAIDAPVQYPGLDQQA